MLQILYGFMEMSCLAALTPSKAPTTTVTPSLDTAPGSNSSIAPQNTVKEPLEHARQVIFEQSSKPIVQIDFSQSHDLWMQFKICREKMCRKREGEGGCEGVTMWMRRCDI